MVVFNTKWEICLLLAYHGENQLYVDEMMMMSALY
jgi:hypothetical protein